MTSFTRIIGAAALLGGVAAPAAAQYAYPQQNYPQQSYPQYPQYPQQNYPGYGYGQGTTGNPITDIVDQLLGNRYNVTDRQAVRQCANAAMSQASAQYNGYNQNQGAYGQRYNNGYNNGGMRVTSITSVERRNNGLRVSGMMSSGGRYNTQGYNNRGYGYNNQGDGQQLSFRCNVDYRGAVTGLRVRPAR